MTPMQLLMYLDYIRERQAAFGGVDRRTGRPTVRFETLDAALAYRDSLGA